VAVTDAIPSAQSAVCGDRRTNDAKIKAECHTRQLALVDGLRNVTDERERPQADQQPRRPRLTSFQLPDVANVQVPLGYREGQYGQKKQTPPKSEKGDPPPPRDSPTAAAQAASAPTETARLTPKKRHAMAWTCSDSTRLLPPVHPLAARIPGRRRSCSVQIERDLGSPAGHIQGAICSACRSACIRLDGRDLGAKHGIRRRNPGSGRRVKEATRSACTTVRGVNIAPHRQRLPETCKT